MIILDVPKSSVTDLRSVMKPTLKERIIWSPFYSKQTKQNILSVFSQKNRLTTKQTPPKQYSIIMTIIPPAKVKQALPELMNKKKPFALYIRWFQLGTQYVQNVIKDKKLFIVQPRENKKLQKGEKTVRVASSFIWLTNIACKSKNEVFVYATK